MVLQCPELSCVAEFEGILESLQSSEGPAVLVNIERLYTNSYRERTLIFLLAAPPQAHERL